MNAAPTAANARKTAVKVRCDQVGGDGFICGIFDLGKATTASDAQDDLLRLSAG